MSKIKATKVIEMPFGGWAIDPTQSNSAAVRTPNAGEYSKSTQVTLFYPSFFGCLTPGPGFDAITDSGSRVTEQPQGIAIASNGEAYSVLRNARIVRFGIGDDVIDNNYTPTMAGAHAAHTLNTSTDNLDIHVFTDTTGVDRILWSWEDDVDADIAMIVSDGSGEDDDWFSTRTSSGVLTKSVPHRIWDGPDGRIYCTNGRYIASYDDVTGIGNTQALDVNFGFVTIAGTNYGLYSAIIGHKKSIYQSSARGECRMWLWDGRSPSFNFEYVIPDNYISRIFNDAGTIYVWTYGRNVSQKLWMFTGESFVLVFETAQAGAAAPSQNAGDTLFNHLVWGTSTGNVVAYGTPNAKNFPAGFHHIRTESNVGFLRQLTSNALYMGHTAGGSVHTIKKINYSKYSRNQTIFRSQLMDFPTNSTITNFKFYFAQFGAGASISVAFTKDYGTASFGGADDLVNTQLTNSANSALYQHIDKTIDNVNSGYLGILWDHASESNTAASIRRIEIDYEYETNTV